MNAQVTLAELRTAVRGLQIHSQALDRLRRFHMVRQDIDKEGTRLQFLAYLLGIMVGDAAKRKVTTKQQKMPIELQLTRKHRDNFRLGEFVGLCVNVYLASV